MKNEYTVIIDAAHGGNDPGANYNNFHEKDYCLYMANYLVNMFNNEKIITKLTRDTDTTLEANNRILKINDMLKNNNKTIIISIHSHFDNINTIITNSIIDDTNLANLIYEELKNNNIDTNPPTTRILPANWSEDYYYIQREIKHKPTIVLNCYYNMSNPTNNCKSFATAIVNAVKKYINDNDTRYSYTVKSGDSLYSIASKNNTTVNEIKSLNNLTSNLLSIGQILEIPDLYETKNYFLYTVKKNDNLYAIARKYNTTVAEIKSLNNLTSNNLSINQVLKIPLKKDSDNEIIISEYQTYTVQKGDSLYTIAKKFNTTVDNIMKTNSLGTTNLSIGQVLKIETKTTNVSEIEECLGDPALYEEDTTTYVVQKGDNLYKIAGKFNVSVNDIVKSNNLISTSLIIGQVLTIPNNNNSSKKEIIYTVKAGDSLYKIAQKFNTTVNNIINDNNLKSNLLSIGQTLIIKGGN